MNLFKVAITTDVIRGRHNFGGTSEREFGSEDELKIFLKSLFKGRLVSFVAGMAISDTLSDTITATVYKNNLPANVKEYL